MRRSLAPKILIALLVTATLLAAWGWRSWSPFGKMVTGDGYAGLILSYDDSRWTPSKQTIQLLEADLKTYLAQEEELRGSRLSSEPTNFWRQYGGYERDGRCFVSVSFFHKDHISRRDCLNAVIVCGGGDFFWSSEYDVEKRSFAETRCNEPM
jgi:hypothetical protein